MRPGSWDGLQRIQMPQMQHHLRLPQRPRTMTEKIAVKGQPLHGLQGLPQLSERCSLLPQQKKRWIQPIPRQQQTLPLQQQSH